LAPADVYAAYEAGQSAGGGMEKIAKSTESRPRFSVTYGKAMTWPFETPTNCVLELM
jgi:hypothetical protein